MKKVYSIVLVIFAVFLAMSTLTAAIMDGNALLALVFMALTLIAFPYAADRMKFVKSWSPPRRIVVIIVAIICLGAVGASSNIRELRDRFPAEKPDVVAKMKTALDAKDYQAVVDTAQKYLILRDADVEQIYQTAKALLDQQERETETRAEEAAANANFAATPALKQFNLDEEKFGASAFCQTEVEKRLHSPKNADFPWSVGQVAYDKAKQQVIIVSYVDAKNGFGADVRQEYVCVVKYQPESPIGWSLIELTGL